MKEKIKYDIDFFNKHLSYNKYDLDLENSNKNYLKFSEEKDKNIVGLFPINNINYNKKYFNFNNKEKIENMLILNIKLNKLSLEENNYKEHINTILYLRKKKIENLLFKKRNIIYFSNK